MTKRWRSWQALRLNPARRATRRLIVTVVGGTALGAGLLLLVLPGPAVLVIPVGLAILATEFVWAQRLLARVRGHFQAAPQGNRADPPVADLPDVLDALVLAGARGSEDAFLKASGAAHRALIPVAGKPLLAYVLEALRGCPRVGAVHASMDTAGAELAGETFGAAGIRLPDAWLPSASSPARSVLAALDSGLHYPLLVTTADHALLTPQILDDFLRGAGTCGGDLVVGVVAKKDVVARYPDTRRTGLRFAGETLCGANLFLLRHPAARNAVAFWVRVEQDRKHPIRLVGHFGLFTALRFALRRLRFDRSLALAGRRMGLAVAAVQLATAEAAIDVDNLEDLALAEAVLRDSRG